MTQWTVGLDWGTSSLRAWLLTPELHAIEQRTTKDGILAVPESGFPAVVAATVGDWIAQYPEATVIACGMVGSRQGWREAPYVPCPAGADEIAARIVEARAAELPPVALVPGLSVEDAAGVPDVMRGEETQVLGALDASAGTAVFVLPGTHSKWVRVASGRILSFKTWMTGEVFAALCEHTILGRLMEPGPDDQEAFADGVARGLEGKLAGSLFSARTLGLFGRIPASGLRAYLSGLLIGAELAEADAMLGGRPPVKVIGGPAPSAAYLRAFELAGWNAVALGEAPTVRGLARLAVAWRSR